PAVAVLDPSERADLWTLVYRLFACRNRLNRQSEPDPGQHVDEIVVSAKGKFQHLVARLAPPGGEAGKIDESLRHARRDRLGAGLFVVRRGDFDDVAEDRALQHPFA